MHRLLQRLLVASAVVALACTTTARAGVATGQAIDGVLCEPAESFVMHIHQHLDVIDHGKPIVIPGDIGRPGQCFYWIHTHRPNGIIHVESPTERTFTLGNVFAVWGQPLTETDVAGAKPNSNERIVTWVDGRRYEGDLRKLELTSHEDITIEVGPPYAQPTPFTEWGPNNKK